MICLFSWWTIFLFGLKLLEKIFLGSHPGINFGAIYYPSLPFQDFCLDFDIFLYCLLSICYNSKTFILSLRRIQKLPPEKFQKSDLLLLEGVHCWRTVHYHPIIHIIPPITIHHPPDPHHHLSYSLISIARPSTSFIKIAFASSLITRSHDQAPWICLSDLHAALDLSFKNYVIKHTKKLDKKVKK